MHIRVPGEIEAQFIAEIRRKRLRLNLVLYPILMAAGTTFLLAKAHTLSRLHRALFSSGPETGGAPIWLFASVLGVVAVAVLGWLRVLGRRPLLQEYPYCSKCDALDFDEAGKCPCCGAPLDEKANFLFTFSDAEAQIARRLGLKESRRA